MPIKDGWEEGKKEAFGLSYGTAPSWPHRMAVVVLCAGAYLHCQGSKKGPGGVARGPVL